MLQPCYMDHKLPSVAWSEACRARMPRSEALATEYNFVDVHFSLLASDSTFPLVTGLGPCQSSTGSDTLS